MTAPTITLYTKDHCPYCVKAKALLKLKGAEFTEIDIGKDRAAMKEMLTRAPGAKTVPQIFIGDTHVGGCDDLYALDAAGKLDGMLKG